MHPDAQRAYDELVTAGLIEKDEPQSLIGYHTLPKAWNEEGAETVLCLSDRAFSTLMRLLDLEDSRQARRNRKTR